MRDFRLSLRVRGCGSWAFLLRRAPSLWLSIGHGWPGDWFPQSASAAGSRWAACQGWLLPGSAGATVRISFCPARLPGQICPRGPRDAWVARPRPSWARPRRSPCRGPGGVRACWVPTPSPVGETLGRPASYRAIALPSFYGRAVGGSAVRLFPHCRVGPRWIHWGLHHVVSRIVSAMTQSVGVLGPFALRSAGLSPARGLDFATRGRSLLPADSHLIAPQRTPGRRWVRAALTFTHVL